MSERQTSNGENWFRDKSEGLERYVYLLDLCIKAKDALVHIRNQVEGEDMAEEYGLGIFNEEAHGIMIFINELEGAILTINEKIKNI